MAISEQQLTNQNLRYRLAYLPVIGVPGLVSGLVYALTAAAGLSWQHGGEDGGDLATAVVLAGVPHPTGYPLYLIISRLFLPLATDPARALNLASAFWGALSASLISLTVFRLGLKLVAASPTEKARLISSSGGIIAGLALAFAPLVWSQALITEVYSFNLALTALLLLMLVYWYEQPTNSRLALAALVAGLAVGHHRTALFTGLAAAIFIIWQMALARQKFTFLQPASAVSLFALGSLAPYLYILVRGGSVPASNWHNAGFANLAGFWQEFSGSDYRNLLFAAPLTQSFGRLAATASYLLQQFGVAGLGLGLVGLTACWFNRPLRPFLGLVTGGMVLHIAFAAIYAAQNSQVYLIPAFSLWAIAIGLGYVWLAVNLPANYRQLSYILVVLLALSVPLISLIANYNRLDLSRSREADLWAKSRLENAPPNAVFISYNDETTFALWYGQYVKNYRPDVAVIEGRLLATDWYRQSIARLYPTLKQADNPVTGSLNASGDYLARLNPDRPVIAILDFGFSPTGDR